jgi:hypothetical protein
METTIRLKPSELNNSMLDMVKKLVKTSGFTEINISLTNNKPAPRLRKEAPGDVSARIEKALEQINSGDTAAFISFSAEEFEQLSQSLQKK